MSDQVHTIILAAGKGTRMESDLPKVLHTLAGKAMLDHVLEAVLPIDAHPTVVVGYGADLVTAHVGARGTCVLQEPQLGTGHAVRTALAAGGQANGTTLVLLGDMPRITTASIVNILETHRASEAVLTLGTVTAPHFEAPFSAFSSYGRVLRDGDGALARIAEVKDASDAERSRHELNTSAYCFDTAWLSEHITELSAHNSAGEYYLTDIVALAVGRKGRTATYVISDPLEALGANTPSELALLEELVKQSDAGAPIA